MPDRQKQMGIAARHLQSRDYSAARDVLLPLCQLQNQVDDATQLLALAQSRLGEYQAASRLYQSYLQQNPANAAVWNNFANHLRKTEPQQACEHYQRALQLKPDYPDALYNLALCQYELKLLDVALATLDRMSALVDQAREKQLRGIVLLDLHRLQDARESFASYLQLKPGSTSGILNLSIAHRRMGEREQAFAILERAGTEAPADLLRERCALLEELGHKQQANEELQRLLQREPMDLQAHDMLDKLHFQLGETDLVGVSLREAYAATGDKRLLGQLALKLEKLGQVDQSAGLLSQVQELADSDPELLRLQVRLFSRSGSNDEADRVFSEALSRFPRQRELLLDCCRFKIRRGELPEAEKLAMTLLEISPNDQEAWSYCSTIWKLAGDSRYPWLCDYQHFVGEYHLQEQGLGEDYIEQLCVYLRQLHDTTHAPIDQTLRGGTQTSGALFNRPDPLIKELVAGLTSMVRGHIEQLPTQEGHPLLGRKSADIVYKGSWSVRLHQQGYHINHNHRDGWLSSALYLALPPGLGGQDNAGCLQLGQSNLGLGDEADPAERIVLPTIGKLAMFPSYMWHGTVPYSDDAERMTVAFDVIPAAG